MEAVRGIDKVTQNVAQQHSKTVQESQIGGHPARTKGE